MTAGRPGSDLPLASKTNFMSEASGERLWLTGAYEKDGRVHGVDVWESAEALQKFMESTLQPTMGKIAAAHGVDLSQAGEPEMSVTEVHRLVH